MPRFTQKWPLKLAVCARVCHVNCVKSTGNASFSQHLTFRQLSFKSACHATSSARTAIRMAVVLFLLLVQWSETHCPTTYGIQSVLWTVSNSH